MFQLNGNKYKCSNYKPFDTLYRPFDANNPMYKAIQDTEHKRSNLFPDRAAVPGRKFKFFLSGGIFLALMSFSHFKNIEQTTFRRVKDTRKTQRRSVPFLQAMEDQRYLQQEEKRSQIFRSLFAYKGEDWYDEHSQYYFNRSFFNPSYVTYPFANGAHKRNVLPYHKMCFSRHEHGIDKFNI